MASLEFLGFSLIPQTNDDYMAAAAGAAAGYFFAAKHLSKFLMPMLGGVLGRSPQTWQIVGAVVCAIGAMEAYKVVKSKTSTA